MRRKQDPARSFTLERQQRVIRSGRLSGVDIDGCSSEVTQFEVAGQRRFVNDTTARGLNNYGPVSYTHLTLPTILRV